MKYQTFAHQINRAKTLLDGMKLNGEELAKWGISPEFVANLTDVYNRANQLEQERNDLRAKSREATATQEQTMAELNSQCGMAKKLIRIALPEESWPAFGFRAGEYAAKTKQPTEPTEPEEPVV